MADRLSILRNAYRKLDSMPLGFGLSKYFPDMTLEEFEANIGIDMDDAMRNMRISDLSSIEPMSMEEMIIEDRVIYYSMRRFRNSSSIYFKFSTAVDGKTVDKTKITATIQSIIDEYDKEYKQWRCSTTGTLWNRGV